MVATSDRISDSERAHARRVDLKSLYEQRYGPMRKNAHHDWQGLCPKCRTDFFHVYQVGTEWKFRCYECHETPGDGIDLLRWLHSGLDFVEAVMQLTGGSMPEATQQQPGRTQPTQSPDWSRKAIVTLRAAQELLLDPEGEQGQEYLTGSFAKLERYR